MERVLTDCTFQNKVHFSTFVLTLTGSIRHNFSSSLVEEASEKTYLKNSVDTYEGMSGGGRPCPPGRPGGMGPGPGRPGMAGAGRPVAGTGGGARLPPIWPPIPPPMPPPIPIPAPVMGAPRRGPPGDGGDNLIRQIGLF